MHDQPIPADDIIPPSAAAAAGGGVLHPTKPKLHVRRTQPAAARFAAWYSGTRLDDDVYFPPGWVLHASSSSMTPIHISHLDELSESSWQASCSSFKPDHLRQ